MAVDEAGDDDATRRVQHVVQPVLERAGMREVRRSEALATTTWTCHTGPGQW